MGIPVGELLERMDSQELAEHMADYQLEPWGEVRADLRMGILASTLANVHRGKGQPARKPKDFMPDFRVKKAQTGADIKMILQGLAMALGGEVREEIWEWQPPSVD